MGRPLAHVRAVVPGYWDRMQRPVRDPLVNLPVSQPPARLGQVRSPPSTPNADGPSLPESGPFCLPASVRAQSWLGSHRQVGKNVHGKNKTVTGTCNTGNTDVQLSQRSTRKTCRQLRDRHMVTSKWYRDASHAQARQMAPRWVRPPPPLLLPRSLRSLPR